MTEKPEIEPKAPELVPGLSGLDDLLKEEGEKKQAKNTKPGDARDRKRGKDARPSGKPEAPAVSKSEAAKEGARSVVSALEGLLQFFEPRFQYTDKAYKDAERKLSPAIVKYSDAGSGFKFMPEIIASLFFGSLLAQGFRAIAALRGGDGDKKPEPVRVKQDGGQGEPATAAKSQVSAVYNGEEGVPGGGQS